MEDKSIRKHKIVLIGYRLSGGGSDKVMANLSIFFEKKGIEVHIITVLDEISYPYKGKLLNLGLLKNTSNGVFNKLKRLIKLKRYIKNSQFDFVIDFRFRTKIIQELIISRLIYPKNSIFTTHSYLIDHYMPNNSWLTRLMYNNCYANVAIVNKMKDFIFKKHKLTNLVTINNPINFEEIKAKKDDFLEIEFEYIIAIGQYENYIKQFDKLISSYSKSILPKKNIHLVILGEGNKENLNLNNSDVNNKIHLLGFQENPYKYLKKAHFLVLSSKNEGFSNVLVESLACETPVISFDCPCGPSEIIIDKKNGLLVEDQNFEKLTEAINELYSNTALYENCKENSWQSVQKFSLENIGNQWLDLMQINL
jgi:glycosyltransferase involved in cell wall biosynthesis